MAKMNVNGTHINGLVQDCGNFTTDALELPQYHAKPSQSCHQWQLVVDQLQENLF